MKLIAKKPCSFGGRQFFIGNEVPTELVASPTIQERLGVLTIVNEDSRIAPDGQSGAPLGKLFTQEEVAEIIAEAPVLIDVKSVSDGGNEQVMEIHANAEEIRQVFSIMQMNAEEGAKVIADVTNENVLILLHAADSRKTIKNAAKEQAAKLYSTEGVSNGNVTTGTNTEGADT